MTDPTSPLQFTTRSDFDRFILHLLNTGDKEGVEIIRAVRDGKVNLLVQTIATSHREIEDFEEATKGQPVINLLLDYASDGGPGYWWTFADRAVSRAAAIVVHSMGEESPVPYQDAVAAAGIFSPILIVRTTPTRAHAWHELIRRLGHHPPVAAPEPEEDAEDDADPNDRDWAPPEPPAQRRVVH